MEYIAIVLGPPHQFGRGRAMPELTRREIEARETRKVFQPVMLGGIDGQKDVAIMFQEGDPDPGKRSLPPPLEVSPAGLVGEDWGGDGCGEAFVVVGKCS